jgi:hypothetical protein
VVWSRSKRPCSMQKVPPRLSKPRRGAAGHFLDLTGLAGTDVYSTPKDVGSKTEQALSPKLSLLNLQNCIDV